MFPFCAHEDCDNNAEYKVYTVEGDIRYVINCCKDHTEWANEYIKADLKKEKQSGDNSD